MKILADNGLIQLIAAAEELERTIKINADTKDLNKRAHDISGAIAGLRFIVKAVKSRYEFTEEESRQLGESAERALAVLEGEAKFMMNLYTLKNKETSR